VRWESVAGAGPDPAGDAAPGDFDPARAHPARIYDHWLGGKNNYAADRNAADHIAGLAPWVVTAARANRAFLYRAITHLAKAGITQFLDIGTGLPTVPTVGEVARRRHRAARVCHVDNDPVVLAHARALLAAEPYTVVVAGDLRHPDAIVNHPEVRTHLDLARPVAVLLVAVLHFLTPDDDPTRVVATLRDALTPGSVIVISHAADLPEAPDEMHRATTTRRAAAAYTELSAPLTLRTAREITALFTGLDLLPPGVVPVHRWRPPSGPRRPAAPVLGGIGRVPDPRAPDPRTPDPGQHGPAGDQPRGLPATGRHWAPDRG
jgi:SAM-dependent methyltransferase